MMLRQHILKHPERYIQGPNTVAVESLSVLLKTRTTINVNISEMAAELWEDIDHFNELWGKVVDSKRPITPPFTTMWMEYSTVEYSEGGGVTGIMVVREDMANGGHKVVYTVFVMAQVYVTEIGAMAIELSKEGCVTSSKSAAIICNESLVSELGYDATRDRIHNACAIACCALAHLHCHNVELALLPAPAPAVKNPKRPVPRFSEWHEIRVKPDAVRKLCREAGRTALDPTGSTKLSWVRGHYADYRNGPGLFGNPKLRVLLWVPEFQRGNAELGEIIPEYTTVF